MRGFLKDESDLVVWTKQEWSDQGIKNQEFCVVRNLPNSGTKLEFALGNRKPVKGFGESSKLHIRKLTLAAPAGCTLGHGLAAARAGRTLVLSWEAMCTLSLLASVGTLPVREVMLAASACFTAHLFSICSFAP